MDQELYNIFLELNRKIGTLAEFLDSSPQIIAAMDSIQETMDKLQNKIGIKN